ncbi:T-complex protein 11 [Forsythia ovata]|uniref:T-complex protein 11 n=1 Tax=Forsythia ovata TaxID=205694 RepID=A0ABD1TMH2_9LAMI
MEFPASDGAMSCSPPTMPPWLRRRLSESKTPPPSTVEEIEARLRDADLRRQKFYENLSSKARPKPRSPSRSSSPEDDLGQRLEAKLQAAEEKRLSILTNAQMRLAKLDELRQAAKIEAEMRFRKERAELGTKVEMRVQQAEANRMLILKAHKQRRATLKERTSQSLLRRMARESKYKERVCTAICQKRAAAEKKRLALLEAEKRRVRARVSQVRKVARSISHQREIERKEMKNKLEDKLQRARRQRAEYLKQRGRPHNFVCYDWNIMQEQADILSRKLARCWRKFVTSKKTTAHLARAYSELHINEGSVKAIPFEQFALLIQSTATLRTAKALLDRIENRFNLSRTTGSAPNTSSLDDIDHLLKRVASPKRRETPRKNVSSREEKKTAPIKQAAKTPVKLSRYQVRVVLCAYMILGHPDAVISGQGEREIALAKSAEKFVKELELLIKITLHGPIQVSDGESKRGLGGRRTFRSQLGDFDSAWCSFLNSFVVWKVKDARSLEEDLVKAACRLELSMFQTCKMTPDGDSGSLTHDMKAIQKQVTEDQMLLREKVLHLSGDAGIERMENALSDTRMKFFEARENGRPISPLSTLILSPNTASPPSLGSSDKTSDLIENTQKRSPVVRSLFRDEVNPNEVSSLASSSSPSQYSSEKLDMENARIVNECVHGENLAFIDSSNSADEGQDNIMAKVRETMKNAYWDVIMESVKQDKSNYGRVVELTREVRDEICAMAPQSWRQEIIEAIDLDILTEVLNSGKVEIDYPGKILEFALITLQKLSAPAYEDELKEKHQKFLKDLAEMCWASDGSEDSHVIALIKGLRFVLEQIQNLKQEISRARIRILEPFLKGPGALEFLGKAFTRHYGHPSNAFTSLPSTANWLSSVNAGKDQEWNEHKSVLSLLTNRNESMSRSFLPSTTLRTGGSLVVKMSTNPADALSTSSYASNLTENIDHASECKGEEIDMLVRLGLLKLVNKVHGLEEDQLPETMKLNFSRLRAVQSRIQKIIVIAISILVLRQALVGQRMVTSQADMESLLSTSVEKLSARLDSNKDAGIQDIIEVLGEAVEKSIGMKLESMEEIMARMLTKNLQQEDAVFNMVSRAIYLAARGVVLGGTGKHGRELVGTALQKVGAALLLDEVVAAASVLVAVAEVSVSVHGPWYASLIKKE